MFEIPHIEIENTGRFVPIFYSVDEIVTNSHIVLLSLLYITKLIYNKTRNNAIKVRDRCQFTFATRRL